MRILMQTLAMAWALGVLSLVPLSPAAAQYGGDALSRMNDVQRNALTDGCWKRYAGNDRKRNACLQGQAYWQNALRDGCHQRYSGNGSKLDRCLDTSNLYGGYGGNSGYQGHSDNYGNSYGQTDGRLFDKALETGCDARFPRYSNDYDACMRGNHYSRSAHADGCNRLYGGGGNRYYRCLDSYRSGGISNYSGGSGFFGGNSGGSGSGLGGLSDIQQNALKDGCWQRYAGNERKRYSCLKGEAHWRDALRDGCWQRYNGNQKKLNRCLDY